MRVAIADARDRVVVAVRGRAITAVLRIKPRSEPHQKSYPGKGGTGQGMRAGRARPGARRVKASRRPAPKIMPRPVRSHTYMHPKFEKFRVKKNLKFYSASDFETCLVNPQPQTFRFENLC